MIYYFVNYSNEASQTLFLALFCRKLFTHEIEQRHTIPDILIISLIVQLLKTKFYCPLKHLKITKHPEVIALSTNTLALHFSFSYLYMRNCLIIYATIE